MGAAHGSTQIERIVRNPSRAIRHSPRVNIEVFCPSRCSHSSIEKWPRNIEPLNNSIDGYLAQNRNSTSFYTDKISVKRLPGEIVTDLDPSKRMNFASSVLGESPKFMDFGLSSVNATGKPNSVFPPLPERRACTVWGGPLERRLARVYPWCIICDKNSERDDSVE